MKPMNELNNLKIEDHSENISRFLGDVLDKDGKHQNLEDSFSVQLRQITRNIAEIQENLTKSLKKIAIIGEDVESSKVEIMKLNMKLEMVEEEVKNIRKDFNGKSDLMIGKFNQMIELLSQIAQN